MIPSSLEERVGLAGRCRSRKAKDPGIERRHIEAARLSTERWCARLDRAARRIASRWSAVGPVRDPAGGCGWTTSASWAVSASRTAIGAGLRPQAGPAGCTWRPSRAPQSIWATRIRFDVPIAFRPCSRGRRRAQLDEAMRVPSCATTWSPAQGRARTMIDVLAARERGTRPCLARASVASARSESPGTWPRDRRDQRVASCRELGRPASFSGVIERQDQPEPRRKPRSRQRAENAAPQPYRSSAAGHRAKSMAHHLAHYHRNRMRANAGTADVAELRLPAAELDVPEAEPRCAGGHPRPVGVLRSTCCVGAEGRAAPTLAGRCGPRRRWSWHAARRRRRHGSGGHPGQTDSPPPLPRSGRAARAFALPVALMQDASTRAHRVGCRGCGRRRDALVEIRWAPTLHLERGFPQGRDRGGRRGRHSGAAKTGITVRLIAVALRSHAPDLNGRWPRVDSLPW